MVCPWWRGALAGALTKCKRYAYSEEKMGDYRCAGTAGAGGYAGQWPLVALWGGGMLCRAAVYQCRALCGGHAGKAIPEMV